MGKERDVTITGIVTDAGWDADNNVIAVCIATANEEDYLVDDDKNGDKLLIHRQEKVRVTGLIREDEDGGKIISVKRFQVVGH